MGPVLLYCVDELWEEVLENLAVDGGVSDISENNSDEEGDAEWNTYSLASAWMFILMGVILHNH